jgi:hypothetical protein
MKTAERRWWLGPPFLSHPHSTQAPPTRQLVKHMEVPCSMHKNDSEGEYGSAQLYLFGIKPQQFEVVCCCYHLRFRCLPNDLPLTCRDAPWPCPRDTDLWRDDSVPPRL